LLHCEHPATVLTMTKISDKHSDVNCAARPSNQHCLKCHDAQPVSDKGVRRDKATLSSECKPRPANALAGRTGAVMEVTKWLKPSGSASRTGDTSSVQVATAR